MLKASTVETKPKKSEGKEQSDCKGRSLRHGIRTPKPVKALELAEDDVVEVSEEFLYESDDHPVEMSEKETVELSEDEPVDVSANEPLKISGKRPIKLSKKVVVNISGDRAKIYKNVPPKISKTTLPKKSQKNKYVKRTGKGRIRVSKKIFKKASDETGDESEEHVSRTEETDPGGISEEELVDSDMDPEVDPSKLSDDDDDDDESETDSEEEKPEPDSQWIFWKHEAVKGLLDAYREIKSERGHNVRVGPAQWKEISDILGSEGFNYNHTACYNKFETLKRRYRFVTNEYNNSGSKISWRYYKDMEKIFSRKSAVARDDTPNKTDTVVVWSRDAVFTLMDTYRAFRSLIHTGSRSKAAVWKMVSDVLRKKGFEYNSTLCNNKMRSLRFRYRAIAGGKVSQQSQATWPFFQTMQRLMATEPQAFQPTRILSLEEDEDGDYDHKRKSTADDSQERKRRKGYDPQESPIRVQIKEEASEDDDFDEEEYQSDPDEDTPQFPPVQFSTSNQFTPLFKTKSSTGLDNIPSTLSSNASTPIILCKKTKTIELMRLVSELLDDPKQEPLCMASQISKSITTAFVHLMKRRRQNRESKAVQTSPMSSPPRPGTPVHEEEIYIDEVDASPRIIINDGRAEMSGLITEGMVETDVYDGQPTDGQRQEEVTEEDVKGKKILTGPFIRGTKKNFDRDAEQLMPLLSDRDFHFYFRMSRSSVQELCIKLDFSFVKRCSSVERRVLAALWLIGNAETFRDTARRFHYSNGGLHYNIGLFCKALKKIRNEFIIWPARKSLDDLSVGFQHYSGMPGVMGALGCTHIRIPPTQELPVTYKSKLGHCSIQLQAVCNSDLQFLDVYTGRPGSEEAEGVFRNSPLYTILENGNLPDGYHILASCAYHLRPYLMVPYSDKGHLTDSLQRFNQRHEGARAHIDRAFCLLRSKFRRIQNVDMRAPDRVSSLVSIACVLYNYVLQREGFDESDFETVLSDQEVMPEADPSDISDLELFDLIGDPTAAQVKRMELSNLVSW